MEETEKTNAETEIKALNFKNWWSKKLYWFPYQWCLICGRLHWAGLPRYTKAWVAEKGYKTFIPGENCKKAWVPLWLPSWKVSCSKACAKELRDTWVSVGTIARSKTR